MHHVCCPRYSLPFAATGSWRVASRRACSAAGSCGSSGDGCAEGAFGSVASAAASAAPAPAALVCVASGASTGAGAAPAAAPAAARCDFSSNGTEATVSFPTCPAPSAPLSAPSAASSSSTALFSAASAASARARSIPALLPCSALLTAASALDVGACTAAGAAGGAASVCTKLAETPALGGLATAAGATGATVIGTPLSRGACRLTSDSTDARGAATSPDSAPLSAPPPSSPAGSAWPALTAPLSAPPLAATCTSGTQGLPNSALCGGGKSLPAAVAALRRSLVDSRPASTSDHEFAEKAADAEAEGYGGCAVGSRACCCRCCVSTAKRAASADGITEGEACSGETDRSAGAVSDLDSVLGATSAGLACATRSEALGKVSGTRPPRPSARVRPSWRTWCGRGRRRGRRRRPQVQHPRHAPWSRRGRRGGRLRPLQRLRGRGRQPAALAQPGGAGRRRVMRQRRRVLRRRRAQESRPPGRRERHRGAAPRQGSQATPPRQSKFEARRRKGAKALEGVEGPRAPGESRDTPVTRWRVPRDTPWRVRCEGRGRGGGRARASRVWQPPFPLVRMESCAP